MRLQETLAGSEGRGKHGEKRSRTWEIPEVPPPHGIARHGMRIIEPRKGNLDTRTGRSLNRCEDVRPIDSERHGMRILRHRRGNPDTGLSRSLQRQRSIPNLEPRLEVSPLAYRRMRCRQPWGRAHGAGELMAFGKSDQAIVLGGRESRLHGEGPDGSSQPAKETTRQTRKTGTRLQTSLRGTATRRAGMSVTTYRDCRQREPVRKRGLPKSPVRENRTPGSERGTSGNRRSYRAVRQGKLGVSCRVQVPAGQGLTTHPY